MGSQAAGAWAKQTCCPSRKLRNPSRLITKWMADELSGNKSWRRMSISFNVLSNLLNMKVGGWRYIRHPSSARWRNLSCLRLTENMRSLEALGVALHASLLVLLAHGIHKSRDGLIIRSLQQFSLMERSPGHHLPTYMMHLYRNFRSNFSWPLDNMEQDAAKRADTVKSMMAKSKICFITLVQIWAVRFRLPYNKQTGENVWSYALKFVHPRVALKDPMLVFFSCQTTSEASIHIPAQGVNNQARISVWKGRFSP